MGHWRYLGQIYVPVQIISAFTWIEGHHNQKLIKSFCCSRFNFKYEMQRCHTQLLEQPFVIARSSVWICFFDIYLEFPNIMYLLQSHTVSTARSAAFYISHVEVELHKIYYTKTFTYGEICIVCQLSIIYKAWVSLNWMTKHFEQTTQAILVRHSCYLTEPKHIQFLYRVHSGWVCHIVTLSATIYTGFVKYFHTC